MVYSSSRPTTEKAERRAPVAASPNILHYSDCFLFSRKVPINLGITLTIPFLASSDHAPPTEIPAASHPSAIEEARRKCGTLCFGSLRREGVKLHPDIPTFATAWRTLAFENSLLASSLSSLLLMSESCDSPTYITEIPPSDIVRSEGQKWWQVLSIVDKGYLTTSMATLPLHVVALDNNSNKY